MDISIGFEKKGAKTKGQDAGKKRKFQHPSGKFNPKHKHDHNKKNAGKKPKKEEGKAEPKVEEVDEPEPEPEDDFFQPDADDPFFLSDEQIAPPNKVEIAAPAASSSASASASKAVPSKAPSKPSKSAKAPKQVLPKGIVKILPSTMLSLPESHNSAKRRRIEDLKAEAAEEEMDVSIRDADIDTQVAPEEEVFNWKYVQDFDIADRTEKQEYEVMKSLDAVVKAGGGQKYPHCVESFEQLGLPPYMYRALQNCNYQQPTPVQRVSMPIALYGMDLVAIAQTGSGKTMAYLIPAIVHIRAKRSPHDPIPSSPQAIILVPTRELGHQVYEQLRRLKCGLKAAYLCGGVLKEKQAKQLEEGVSILIGTPGRILDHLNAKSCSVKDASFVVIDEADRMLDFGFEPQLQSIMKEIKARRIQTLMFSATWSKDVQRAAVKFMTQSYPMSSVRILIGQRTDDEEALTTKAEIVQRVEIIDNIEFKRRRLSKLMKEWIGEPASVALAPAGAASSSSAPAAIDKILVFVAFKERTEPLANSLKEEGWPVAAIHGDMNQKTRFKVMQKFISGETPILVSTDLSARGLDIQGVQYVVNFDFPKTFSDYVHRIGRTARGVSDSSGSATSFFSLDDRFHALELVGFLRKSGQEVPDALQAMARSNGTRKREQVMKDMYGPDMRKLDAKAPQNSKKIVFKDDE